MSYQVKTRVFEGPLDLLLQLITSHQLEITELSLTDLVGEYLAHLEEMRRLDLDVTSEFLLIAAILIQLKARHLLPGETGVDPDEELALAEERDRLLARLLACLTFKDVAAVFAHRFTANQRFVPRRFGLDQPVRLPPRPVRIGAGPAGLARVADRVFRRARTEPELDHLDFDLPSVEAAMADVRARMDTAARTTFEALVDHCERRIDVVAYFLAVLELARWGVVTLSQADGLAPIAVGRGSAAWEEQMHSEWSVP